jgi:hypothetical protein
MEAMDMGDTKETLSVKTTGKVPGEIIEVPRP